MAASLTDDDVGKTVVDANGKELGVVSNVDGDAASVDPNPSLLDTALAKVGWDRSDDEAYTIREDMLDRIDDEVVLRGTI
ncbi:hypothetical protein OB905_09850 [Halobacteria archaeon AArc-dxtr1]|nr:hypothetical protein [Halobacteria archaeon AArc-dxtr1]